MRRTLLPGMLAALWLGSGWNGASRAADPPLYNTPASYRLFNPSTIGPSTTGCGRCEPLPCCNPGCFLDNPRGTGSDDPWRPPHVWPQTRYPVIPAYTRPSYGYYETSWRLLPLCNPTPRTAGPVYPAGYQSSQPPAAAQPAATPPAAPVQQQPAPTQGPPIPRPPVVPPAVQPAEQGPPAAVPPAAGGLPGVPLQPKKATPPSNELQPPPPKATPPATPRLKGPAQGAAPLDLQREALLDPPAQEAQEVRVQPF